MLVALLVAGMIGVAIQNYAMRKIRGGFSLRGDGSPAPQRRKFADPEEEATRRWLEAENNAELNEPQRHGEHRDVAEKTEN